MLLICEQIKSHGGTEHVLVTYDRGVSVAAGIESRLCMQVVLEAASDLVYPNTTCHTGPPKKNRKQRFLESRIESHCGLDCSHATYL